MGRSVLCQTAMIDPKLLVPLPSINVYYSIDYCREQSCHFCHFTMSLNLTRSNYSSLVRLGGDWIRTFHQFSGSWNRGWVEPFHKGFELRVERLGRGIKSKFKTLSSL